MAISRIGTPAAADGTTITIPVGHQIGDAILMYAFAATNATPALPAGWTNLANTNAGASGQRVGYKIATSSSETSGTWTSATGLACIVLRGVSTFEQPFPVGGGGLAGGATGTGTVLTYPSVTINAKNIWFVAFAGMKTTLNNLALTPTSLTNEVDTNGAATEYAIHDSNGLYVHNGSYPSNTVSVGATSAEWRTYVTPVFPEVVNQFENYRAVSVADNGNAVMSVSEKIR